MMLRKALALMAGALLCAGSARSSDLYPLSSAILNSLAFESSELPPGYALTAPASFLTTMGMEHNPDYICNLEELESIGRRGGCAPFLATYGHGDHIRLLLNGIFFRYEKHARDFLHVQKDQKRCVAVYQRVIGDGVWILLYARDPDAIYEEPERRELEAAIARHARRISAKPVFSTLWTNAIP